MRLTVNNLSIKYGNRNILNNAQLFLDTGEIIAVNGKNGSGKSTLCSAICGIAKNYNANVTGEVLIDDTDLFSLSTAQKSEVVGFIPQNPDAFLFSQIVEEELAFAPENLCLPRHEIELRINNAAQLTGITHLLKRNINDLSGGEKQLVAIASVLTLMPRFILADEITSGLDNVFENRIRKLLVDLKKEGAGILLISHNHTDTHIADRSYLIENGGIFEI